MRLLTTRREQRRLVHEIHQIGAREARRAARDHLQIHIRRQRHLAGVDLEDLLAADEVGVRHIDLTIEAARTHQRRIEHVRTVGRGDEDDALIGLEAVHLDQQLVQRLLALVIAAAETGAAMTADRVDLVDEDDAGRVLLRLLEHVAHAAGADADEHFDEVRARDGEEGHVRLARNGAGEQRLAGAGRSDQQHAARNAAAEALELLRIAQEFDDLLQILLRLVDAGDILEGDAPLRLRQQLRLRLAKAHGAAGAALHLARQENPHAEEGDERQRR